MTRIILILFLGAMLHFVVCGTPAHVDQKSDATAINLLLRLFDTIAEKNPDYEDTLKALASLDSQLQEERLTALIERNANDLRIAGLIDSLLESPAYELYYRQFKRMTPDIHRGVLTALPYRAVRSPADIGRTQFEMFHHRDSLRVLAEKISELSVDRVASIARQWAPPGDLPAPMTYYILDGYGDAFAKDDEVCFDLFSLVLRKRSVSSRYDNLADVAMADVEAVLAHEFQHVFAQPYLYPPTREFDNWQDLWEDVIMRRIVSEGVATQCNPLSGFKREVFEDAVVVDFWLRELERVVGQIRRDEIDEDSVRVWLDRSYQESARQVLKEYLERRYPEGDQRQLMWEHSIDRPMGIYTLGWWMISHIVAANGRESAVQLLTYPHGLFRLYNSAIDDPMMKIAL